MLLELLSEFKSLEKNHFTMSNQEKLKKSSSPEVSTSISEFLEQERLCKELCSTIASDGVAASVDSVRAAEFPRCDSALNISDLSDDDIGSILEKMNQIMSPSKSSQDSGSMSNSLYDGKQDRNIEDILLEAETLMHECSSIQPPSITNLLVETSNNSRAQSPNGRSTSASLSYHSMNSDHKIGKDVNLQQEKTEYAKVEKTSGGSVKGKIHQNETKDPSITKPLELSVNSSLRLKTKSQLSDSNNQRKTSYEPKVKDNGGGARQVDLNQTFLVENNAHTGSNFHSRSTSKGKMVSHGPNTCFSSQSVSNHLDRVDSTKKSILAQVNSQIDCKEESEEKCYREYLSKSAPRTDRESALSNEQEESIAKKAEEVYEEIRVEIEQVLKSKAAKLDGLGTPIQTPILNGSFPNLKLSYPGLETPSVDVPSCFNLEKEFLEERKRCLKLKADLEWIGRVHSDEVTQLQRQHNEEMFALKKEIVLLTAQLSEKIRPAPTVNSAKESDRHKVEMLEKEMAEQEVLLAGYQRENELLCAELRSVKEELNRAKTKMVATSGTASVRPRSEEDIDAKLRERDELIAKLNAEVCALQEMAETTRNLRAVNANLQREVERLQSEIAQPQTARSMTSQSSNLVSELERVRSELDSKRAEMKRLQENLRAAKEETSSLKATLDQRETLARSLETTVTGLRANLASEKEKAAEHERATAKDAARIRDLDRQVKELEGIVMRQKKHQAAAIFPGSNAGAMAHERILQERIDQLEAELSHRQSGVTRLQTQLASVKTKYEDLIANLEQKLANSKDEISELKVMLAQSHKETSVNSTQTIDDEIPAPEIRSEGSDGESAALPSDAATKDSDSEPVPKGRRRVRGTAKRRSASAGAGDVTRGNKAPVRRASASMDVRTSASSRQDIHLICTIRGLQQELSARDRDVQRLQRELNEIRATNRRLQQERERLLKQSSSAPVTPPGASGSTGTAPRNRPSKKEVAAGDTASVKTDVGVQVKNSVERSFDASNCSYDPSQFEANDSERLIADLQRENRGLRDDVVRLQEDLLGLHAKRATDINRLQSKHDEEIQRILERHSGPRTGAARVADLQGQLYTQQLVITHLKEQLKQLEKTAKEVALLKKERDHLEETVVDMTKKISRLRDMHNPDTVKYAALQDKVDELEARHECRERKLQAIIRDLQQQYSAASCGGCGPSCGLSAGGSSAGEGCSAATRLLQKNRDLCLYRAELDRLLTALRQLDALRKNNQPE